MMAIWIVEMCDVPKKSLSIIITHLTADLPPATKHALAVGTHHMVVFDETNACH
jgi:hypothetical protein